MNLMLIFVMIYFSNKIFLLASNIIFSNLFIIKHKLLLIFYY